jgi:ubiquilin
MGGLGGFGGLAGLGAGGGGGLRGMAEQMMAANPEFIQQMMESPLVQVCSTCPTSSESNRRQYLRAQSLLSNPSFMDSIMNSNPETRAIMEANPELARAMRDPQTMRMMMQASSNPEYYREMMRNNDRALRVRAVCRGLPCPLVRRSCL